MSASLIALAACGGTLTGAAVSAVGSALGGGDGPRLEANVGQNVERNTIKVAPAPRPSTGPIDANEVKIVNQEPWWTPWLITILVAVVALSVPSPFFQIRKRD